MDGDRFVRPAAITVSKPAFLTDSSLSSALHPNNTKQHLHPSSFLTVSLSHAQVHRDIYTRARARTHTYTHSRTHTHAHSVTTALITPKPFLLRRAKDLKVVSVRMSECADESECEDESEWEDE